MSAHSFCRHALLLVLTLLGHDLLMASVTHAEPARPRAASHEQRMVHEPVSALVVSPYDNEQPAHPETCGVAGVAVPSSGFQVDATDHIGDKVVVDACLLERDRSAWYHQPEPLWPPGTMRALLQVYRL